MGVLVMGPAPGAQAGQKSSRTVVFVCEHGTVKSVMAMLWFDRLARERGLPVRAVSRGMTPDAGVPPAIAEGLRADGLELGGFRPARLSEADLAGALRVVAIGVDTSTVTGRGRVPVEAWNDIPPATQDYAAARAALRARIARLIDETLFPARK